MGARNVKSTGKIQSETSVYPDINNKTRELAQAKTVVHFRIHAAEASTCSPFLLEVFMMSEGHHKAPNIWFLVFTSRGILC